MKTILYSSGQCKPEATILQFPSSLVMAIGVEREFDGDAWLIRTYNREHGWLYGDFESAIRDAHEIAATYGVTVISSAGRLPC